MKQLSGLKKGSVMKKLGEWVILLCFIVSFQVVAMDPDPGEDGQLISPLAVKMLAKRATDLKASGSLGDPIVLSDDHATVSQEARDTVTQEQALSLVLVEHLKRRDSLSELPQVNLPDDDQDEE